jgi:hypothetical protein
MNKNAFSQHVYVCNTEAYPKFCTNIQESLAITVRLRCPVENTKVWGLMPFSRT